MCVLSELEPLRRLTPADELRRDRAELLSYIETILSCWDTPIPGYFNASRLQDLRPHLIAAVQRMYQEEPQP